MRAVGQALWERPSVFLGALQAVNAAIVAAVQLPVYVALPIAALIAIVNVAANNPPPERDRPEPPVL